MEKDILETAELDLESEGSNIDEPKDASLPEVVHVPGTVEAFDAIQSDWNGKDVVKVTKQAAEKLNLGLLASTLDVVMESRRTLEKIRKLEDIIYTKEGINCDKDIISLYNAERNTYASQIEMVRKYVLNNKSALEELDKPTQEVFELLRQLTPEKLALMRKSIEELRKDDSVDDSDLLSDK